MTLTDCIEVNPRVIFGKAVIRGPRIPVEFILRKLSEIASDADLLAPRLTRDLTVRAVSCRDWRPLTARPVKNAFARRVQRVGSRPNRDDT